MLVSPANLILEYFSLLKRLITLNEMAAPVGLGQPAGPIKKAYQSQRPVLGEK